MIRLFLRLLKITDFEPNESVAILKQQLDYERARVAELTAILTRILEPQVVTQNQQPVEISPLDTGVGLWSRKRAALEARDRAEAQIKKQSTNLGKPDDRLKDINNLEKELGISEEKSEQLRNGSWNTTEEKGA